MFKFYNSDIFMFSGYQDTSMFMHLTVLFWEVNNLCSLQSFVVVLVWEEYLFTALGTQREKTCLNWGAKNKGADQPAHLCSLKHLCYSLFGKYHI